MERKYYKWPFSSSPWTKYKTLSKLPVLEKGVAITVWMIIGICFGLLGAGAVFTFGLANKANELDPMLDPGLIINILFFVPLLVTTVFIGLKQWAYYYGNGNPKDGIFVEKIRQVNQREMITDCALSVAGGFLVGVCFLPSYWFLSFAFYCALIILRCYLTLMRPKYANIAKRNGEKVPAFVGASIKVTHNHMLVKGVLAGWIVSDIVYILYSIIAFILCFFVLSNFSIVWRIVIFALVLGVLYVLFLHVIRMYSYGWGLWLLRKFNMNV
jgi:hypothetical protein